jgi:hypothetical protein
MILDDIVQVKKAELKKAKQIRKIAEPEGQGPERRAAQALRPPPEGRRLDHRRR